MNSNTKFSNMNQALFIISVLTLLTTGICQTLEQSKNLTRDVLSGYDKRQRPVLDQSKSVNVTVTFDIVSIQDFDEVKESFSVVGLLYLSWTDESIAWNPADYGGIGSQMFNLDDVWYPILIQSNPYDSVKDIGDDWMTVRIMYTGQAFFSPGAVFKSTCSVDVTYYPFDTQSCELLFIPWGFFAAEMRLIPDRADVLRSYYSPNGEWNLVSSLVEHSSDDFDAVSFTFTIERKPLFLVINVVLPIIFMAVINLLVFVLPVESGERVSYAVTVLLSLAVFLTLILKLSCELLFIPWGFLAAEMRLIPARADVLRSYYSPNGEWNLVSSLVEHSSDDFDAVSFTFTIERKPLFLVINVVLPIIFMAVINLLVFVLPVESGERVSYAVTVLLSLAVFLTLVGDNMPKTSEPMSILCYFLMLILVLSTLMCVVTIFNLRIFHKKSGAIPPWCAAVTRLLVCKTRAGCCHRGAKVEDTSQDNVVQYIGVDKDGMAKLDKAEMRRLGKQISGEYEKASNDRDDDEAEVTWKDVSQAVDRASLVLFSVTLAAIVAANLYILISNKTPEV